MQWVVFTNVYVALCGAALTAETYVLLGEPARIDHVCGLVFCCTLVIYNLDRLVEPYPGDSVHERWIERHRRSLWGILIAAAMGAIVFAIMLAPAAQWSLAPAGAVALFYCLPIARRKQSTNTWYRLKDLPGAKLALIAGVWTYATAGLPMFDSGALLNQSTTMVLLSRLCFLAAVALPFDLPDMARDRRSGIVTIPTWLGVNATRNIALGLAALSAGFALLNPWPAASALLISCAVAAGLIAMLRADRGVLYFMVALDGMLLVKASLLWISTV